MIAALELLALTVALALDAVAVTAGLAAGRAGGRELAVASVVFGVFQAGMAGGGALGGAWLAARAEVAAGVVAFLLLTVVGGRMIVGTGEEEVESGLSASRLAVLGLATSLDALAAGVGLPHLDVALPISAVTIGVGTTVLCGMAAVVGSRVGDAVGPRAERVGGAVLVLVGARILLSAVGVLP